MTSSSSSSTPPPGPSTPSTASPAELPGGSSGAPLGPPETTSSSSSSTPPPGPSTPSTASPAELPGGSSGAPLGPPVSSAFSWDSGEAGGGGGGGIGTTTRMRTDPGTIAASLADAMKPVFIREGARICPCVSDMSLAAISVAAAEAEEVPDDATATVKPTVTVSVEASRRRPAVGVAAGVTAGVAVGVESTTEVTATEESATPRAEATPSLKDVCTAVLNSVEL
mmetsp:Transcript_22583/g.70101  ORF Transcript_22583/g.70101 Transcript_22583/m.70101 type:complete len:225 (+) Transcript_22583:1387-2061(+)